MDKELKDAILYISAALIVFTAIIFFQTYWEMISFNEVCKTDVSFRQALFLSLRVDSCIK